MRYSQLINLSRHLCKLLLSVAALILFTATARKSQYSHLKPTTGDINCIRNFAPHFSNTLYSASIDVTTHHFSGILFFKLMPDSSTRVVFTNEMGVKFFDFAFTKDNEFIRYYVMPKMDKKVVVKALHNDLELVILHQDLSKAVLLTDSVYNYTAIPTPKGKNYYITDKCSKLIRVEKSSKIKPVVEVQMLNYTAGVPDSISIEHKNFKFNISLKKIDKE
jgi:hypothetical protein